MTRIGFICLIAVSLICFFAVFENAVAQNPLWDCTQSYTTDSMCGATCPNEYIPLATVTKYEGGMNDIYDAPPCSTGDPECGITSEGYIQKPIPPGHAKALMVKVAIHQAPVRAHQVFTVSQPAILRIRQRVSALSSPEAHAESKEQLVSPYRIAVRICTSVRITHAIQPARRTPIALEG